MEASKLEADKKFTELQEKLAAKRAEEEEKAREAAAYKAVKDKEESDLAAEIEATTDIASLYSKVVALVQR